MVELHYTSRGGDPGQRARALLLAIAAGSASAGPALGDRLVRTQQVTTGTTTDGALSVRALMVVEHLGRYGLAPSIDAPPIAWIDVPGPGGPASAART